MPRLTICVAVASIFCFSGIPSQAQNYLTATGGPTYSAPEPVEYGFVETANGNLHLEFPLGSFPQRGSKQPYSPRLVYDSHFWTIPIASTYWSAANTPGEYFPGAGFRFIESTW